MLLVFLLVLLLVGGAAVGMAASFVSGVVAIDVFTGAVGGGTTFGIAACVLVVVFVAVARAVVVATAVLPSK